MTPEELKKEVRRRESASKARSVSEEPGKAATSGAIRNVVVNESGSWRAVESGAASRKDGGSGA